MKEIKPLPHVPNLIIRWSTYNEQLRVFEGKCFECGTHYEVREQEAATGYIPCPKCKEKAHEAEVTGGK
jgi:Zn finger protein HypA/HybF involved in hydrogenase expression